MFHTFGFGPAVQLKSLEWGIGSRVPAELKFRYDHEPRPGSSPFGLIVHHRFEEPDNSTPPNEG
jgi:hypothetical protein